MKKRYTTSHPVDFKSDLIDAHATCKKLMPLIHLPVQSGSNKNFKRHEQESYNEDYLLIIEKLKKVDPAIEFSSDFIIGYPKETEEDFLGLNLLKKIKYINTFSFIFRRPVHLQQK